MSGKTTQRPGGKVNMDPRKMTEAILNDPATSYWLRRQVEALALRDPVDALHDIQALLVLYKAINKARSI